MVNKIWIKSLRLISFMSMIYWNLEDEKAAIPFNCLNFTLFNLLLKEKLLYCSEQYHLHIISGILWWSSVVYLWEEHREHLGPVRNHCSIIMVSPACQLGPWFWLWIKVCLSLSSDHLIWPPWQCLIMNRRKDFSRSISWIYTLWK